MSFVRVATWCQILWIRWTTCSRVFRRHPVKDHVYHSSPNSCATSAQLNVICKCICQLQTKFNYFKVKLIFIRILFVFVVESPSTDLGFNMYFKLNYNRYNSEILQKMQLYNVQWRIPDFPGGGGGGGVCRSKSVAYYLALFWPKLYEDERNGLRGA